MRRYLLRFLIVGLTLLITGVVYVLTGPRWFSRSASSALAFIPQVTANDVWEPSHMGALAAVSGSRYDIYWNGPTDENDASTQISLIDEAIHLKRAGIILAPDQPLALILPVERATRHAIPVVIIGSELPLPRTTQVSYVINDEEEAGRLLAARLGQQIHGSGRVAVIGVNPDRLGLVQRMHVMERCLLRDYPRIKIVSRQSGTASEAQSEQSTRELLSDGLHVDAIIAMTSEATEGAHQAIQDTGGDHHVLLIGTGQEYLSLYYLSESRIDSLLVENTYAMGYKAAQILVHQRLADAKPQRVQVAPLLITREIMYRPEFTSILTHLGENRP